MGRGHLSELSVRKALSGNRDGEVGGLAASRQGLQAYSPSFAAALAAAAAAAACVPTPGGEEGERLWKVCPCISRAHLFQPQENQLVRGFPGGAVVKNPPANAGDTGSSPGLGGSHIPQSS